MPFLTSVIVSKAKLKEDDGERSKCGTIEVGVSESSLPSLRLVGAWCLFFISAFLQPPANNWSAVSARYRQSSTQLHYSVVRQGTGILKLWAFNAKFNSRIPFSILVDRIGGCPRGLCSFRCAGGRAARDFLICEWAPLSWRGSQSQRRSTILQGIQVSLSTRAGGKPEGRLLSTVGTLISHTHNTHAHAQQT